MGLRRHRVRSDASSTLIEAQTPTAVAWKWSDTLDVRDFTHVALFLHPSSLSSATFIDIVVGWSDDGTTIPFTDDDNQQQSDFNIGNFTDGTFKPKPYIAVLTLVGGELVDGKQVHLVVPVKAGFMRVGVRANAVNASYNLRAQRLVR